MDFNEKSDLNYINNNSVIRGHILFNNIFKRPNCIKVKVLECTCKKSQGYFSLISDPSKCNTYRITITRAVHLKNRSMVEKSRF